MTDRHHHGDGRIWGLSKILGLKKPKHRLLQNSQPMRQEQTAKFYTHRAFALKSARFVIAGCAFLLMGNAAFLTPPIAHAATPVVTQIPRLKPLAPGPQHLSRNDYDHLKNIIEATGRKSWARAKSAIAQIDNPEARSLGQWYYYDARDPRVNIAEGIEFLNTHEGWPSLARIQSHLEAQLKDTSSTDLIYQLFEKRDPITGNGKIQFIRMLMKRGEREAAKLYVRDAWVNHRFSSSQERTILSRYTNLLSESDHIGRVDNLLWARRVTASRRTFSKLPTHERTKAKVRDAFYIRAGNAQQLYNALPAKDRSDPGVLHAAIRYFRRSNKQDRAIALVKSLPDNENLLRNPARFWQERNLLMRWALKEGQFHDAYAMANGTGLTQGLDLAEAEFNAGWIALRFLNQPQRAEQHFLSLASWATSPISTARAYYWLARTAQAEDKTDLARQRFAYAAQHIYTYYGQLAAEELGGKVQDQRFVSTAVIKDSDRIKFDTHPSALAFKMISDLNHRRSLLRFSYNLDDKLETPGEYLLLSEITAGEGAPNLTIRAGKTAVRRQKLIPEISYPLMTIPGQASRFVAPELILGLSRQESEFNPTANSSAGAKGIMQLLPSTAQLTARKEGLRYYRSRLLSDPDYNITIGSAHLSHLIERFEGSWIMTFVGYNAGPHRATQWIESYGDPRSLSVDPIDWIELIPFSETRNYVQRVLENTQIYRARLTGGAIAGSLHADIERGGHRNRAAKISPPSVKLKSLSTKNELQSLPPLSRLTAQRARTAALNLPSINKNQDHLALNNRKVIEKAISPPITSPDTPEPIKPAPAPPSGEAEALQDKPEPKKNTPGQKASQTGKVPTPRLKAPL